MVCRPRVSNTPPLPPCYEVRTHLRPILHMVLRHLLIASQLQLLDSPPLTPPRRRTAIPRPQSPLARLPHPFVAAPKSRDGGGGGGLPVAASESAGAGDTEKRRRQGERLNGATASTSAGEGRGFGEWGEGAADAESGQNRDWHGTNSDAFEIAVAVLKVRCD